MCVRSVRGWQAHKNVRNCQFLNLNILFSLEKKLFGQLLRIENEISFGSHSNAFFSSDLVVRGVDHFLFHFYHISSLNIINIFIINKK